MVISILAAVKVLGYEGDFGALAATVTGNAEWMSSWPHRFTSMPAGYEAFQWLRFAAVFYVIKNIIHGCETRGLLLLSCGTYDNVIRWIPPLVVSEAQVNEGLGIFAAALKESV